MSRPTRHVSRAQRIVVTVGALWWLLTPVAEAQPADSLARARELNAEVVRHYHAGRYADAVSLARESLALREAVLGPNHPDVAQSLNNLAQLLRERRLFLQYSKVAWLAAEHAITVLSSATALRVLRQRPAARTAPAEPFNGIGDPQLAGRGARRGAPMVMVRGGELLAELRALDALPRTRDELHAIGRALGADAGRAIYVGARARKPTVLALDAAGRLGRVRVLAFATHGLLAGEIAGLKRWIGWWVTTSMALAVTLAAPAPASAWMAFAKITGSTVIAGDATAKGFEKQIVVLGLGNELNRAVVTGSGGFELGKLTVGPLQIVKAFDIATPRLIQAAASGEALKLVEITLFKTTTTGTNVPAFKITLTNAVLSNVSTTYDPGSTPAALKKLEIHYQKVLWTDLLSSTSGGTP